MTRFLLGLMNNPEQASPNGGRVEWIGAMAEQLGSGLQNRVHRCDSGSRLDFDEKGPSAAAPRVAGLCGVSTDTPPRLLARSLHLDLFDRNRKDKIGRGGGTGLRMGLKIPRPSGHESSNLSPGTDLNGKVHDIRSKKPEEW